MQTPEKVMVYTMGPTVLLNQLCKEIHFEETINRMVAWDQEKCRLSPGTRLKALVLNILTSHTPLYRVEDFYAEQDLALLFREPVQANDLNDDALGRALDKLYAAESWKVYSTLAFQALRVLNLPVRLIHGNTTSVSLQGVYEREADLKVTYGHSKDHRPDLKQILIGMGVTPERIPLLVRAEDGNLSDKVWNREFIQKMRALLSQEDWQRLVYVADSALVTKTNLAWIQEQGLHFVSRLPDTFALGEAVKQTAWEQGNWQEAGPLRPGKQAATCRWQAFTRTIEGHPYRLLVVHSDPLDKRKARSLEKALEKDRNALEKALTDLQKTPFHCQADAEKAIQAFSREQAHPLFRWELEVRVETRALKRSQRGRPKKGAERAFQSLYFPHCVTFTINQEALEEKKRRLSTFVLISNAETIPDQQLLQAYKGQAAAETRFRLLKDPQLIHGIYLKHPHRIEALSTVFVMALLLYGMLEYRVREQMEQAKEPLYFPSRSKTYKPTGKVLLERLRRIKTIVINEQGRVLRYVSDNVDPLTERIVQMAGYDMSIYIAKDVEMTQQA